MFPTTPPLTLSKEDSEKLERIARDRSSDPRLAKRCWVILMAAEGISSHAISQTVEVSRPTVLKWRALYESEGLSSVLSPRIPRLGRPSRRPPEETERLAERARQLAKKHGISMRETARILKCSKSTLHRILSST